MRTLVTCYIDPDLDGFACALAYIEYLSHKNIEALPCFFDTPQSEARFLMEKYQIKPPENVAANPEDRVILVDASDLNGLDKSINPDQVIEIIDHRKFNDSALFPKAQVQIELVGSAATLIAEKFEKENLTISRSSAVLLYGAIVSNTLNFKSKTTTPRDIKMADWLNSILNFTPDFVRELFLSKSDMTGSKLRDHIEQEFAWATIGQKRIGVGQLELIGAEELVSTRQKEVLEILTSLKSKNNLDLIYLSIIDLEADQNIFICQEKETQEILARVLNIHFEGSLAKREGLIMRKEILPLLKEYLGKK